MIIISIQKVSFLIKIRFYILRMSFSKSWRVSPKLDITHQNGGHIKTHQNGNFVLRMHIGQGAMLINNLFIFSFPKQRRTFSPLWTYFFKVWWDKLFFCTSAEQPFLTCLPGHGIQWWLDVNSVGLQYVWSVCGAGGGGAFAICAPGRHEPSLRHCLTPHLT